MRFRVSLVVFVPFSEDCHTKQKHLSFAIVSVHSPYCLWNIWLASVYESKRRESESCALWLADVTTRVSSSIVLFFALSLSLLLSNWIALCVWNNVKFFCHESLRKWRGIVAGTAKASLLFHRGRNAMYGSYLCVDESEWETESLFAIMNKVSSCLYSDFHIHMFKR